MRNFGDFLDKPVADLAGPLLGADLPAADTIVPGTRIGPYRVIREIGRGGMGVVCLAERDQGAESSERVALKIVQRRFAVEPTALRRFREERQILAPLEHPGIARLQDGGVEPDGTPWFAMEYVDGIPIDRYCTAHGLDVPQRLELFAKACDAVEHAHRLSIVHRDIKSSHILVTADRAVKLLDFGIAKLVVSDGGVSAYDPTFTQPQLLTPAYASPEQLRGERVSPSSDVYALGVLLYRLLTGRLPARRAADVVRSTKPRTYESPPSLGPDLPAPLNSITTKALQPEMDRRYQTAGELAADIRAFLSGAPIAARSSPIGALMRRLFGIVSAVAGLACGAYTIDPPVPPTTVSFLLAAPLCSSILHVQLSIDKAIVATDTFVTITGIKDTTSKQFAVLAGQHSVSANVISGLGSGFVWPEKMVAVPAGTAYVDTLPFYCS